MDQPQRFLLLASAYDRLTLPQRASALIAGREAGRSAADCALTLESLEAPQPTEYLRHVVKPAVRSGAIDQPGLAQWQRACGEALGLRDPRVQAFFFGWHERATEIMAEISADGPDGDGVRARWFLDGVQP